MKPGVLAAGIEREDGDSLKQAGVWPRAIVKLGALRPGQLW